MPILNRFKKSDSRSVPEERSFLGDFSYNGISTYFPSQPMSLAAVYAATNCISNSCALLPTKILKTDGGNKIEVSHPLAKVLNLKPNQINTHYNFFKLLIESVILKGNGYALIERDERLNVKSLHLVNPDLVTPMLQADGSVKYSIHGYDKAVNAEDIIHLYQHIDSNHKGLSVLKYAAKSLSIVADTESLAGKFFKSGAGVMGILKSSSPLTYDQKKQAADSWKRSIQENQSVAIMPYGMDFQKISIDPEDAQLLSSRQYGVVEIARFFNISPIKLFDYSHISYGTLEQVNLSYLQDTLMPYITMLQDEFNTKLFKPSEIGKLSVLFDYSVLLSSDKTTEANYYGNLIKNGIMTINECRSKLGLSPFEGTAGDSLFMQISYGSAQDIADGKYIKQEGQDQNTEQDNKLNNDE